MGIPDLTRRLKSATVVLSGPEHQPSNTREIPMDTTCQPAHLVIAGNDTVHVRGEHGGWVVGAIRPANPSSNRADMRVTQALVTRVTGGGRRRSITSTSMWIDHDRLTLARKGNADADNLIALFGEDCTAASVPYVIAVTLAGHSTGRVLPA